MNPYFSEVVPTVFLKGEHIQVGNAVPGRALPAGKAWVAHDGAKARLRRQRQHWARVEREAARDPMAYAAREALLDAASQEPDSERVAMQYAMMAREASDLLRCSWATSVTTLAAKREAMARKVLDGYERQAAE